MGVIGLGQTASWQGVGGVVPPVLNFQPPRVLHIGEGMHCLQSVGRHSCRHNSEIVGQEIKSRPMSSQYHNITDGVTDDLRIAIYTALCIASCSKKNLPRA